MAPLFLGDNIDISSLAATWLGTVFAAIGFVAIWTQLKLTASSFFKSRKFLMERSAGEWAILVPIRNMPPSGLVECVAPSFQAWLQNAYLTDKTISLTWDYRRGAGTSGWSNLFAHAGIKAHDLLAFGGPDSKVYPAVTGDLGPGDPPRLSDMIFEEGKVSYGFTRNEFTALLVLCGFRITDFSPLGLTSSNGLLGTMALVEKEPFSQLGRFDPHDGCRYITKDLQRYVNELPVRRCIDYALGVLPTVKRGDHNHIIPAATPQQFDSDDISAGLQIWSTLPSAFQLNQLKYTLEQFVSISGGDLLKYPIQTSVDIQYEQKAMEKINPGFTLNQERNHRTMLIAHALSALQPWGLLPVLPSHFANAFKPLVSLFAGTRAESVTVLHNHMCQLRLEPLEGWDSIEQQAAALAQIGEIRTDFFTRSNSPCRQYFKAMVMVFEALKLPFADVRNMLAAKVAHQLLEGEPLSEDFVSNMTVHLGNGQPQTKIPDWAVQVYATYLWGWFGDHIPMDFDYHTRFNRRIFLT